MKIKGLVDEDYVNYKKASMFIIFPYCSFKCEKENCEVHCQNSKLANSKIIDYPLERLLERYLENNMTSSIVCGGLEPMDSFEDVYDLLKALREYREDDFVIYTGYYKEEIEDKINKLKEFKNVIVKFGRFIPNQKSHFDSVLGVELASDNQYAEVIS